MTKLTKAQRSVLENLHSVYRIASKRGDAGYWLAFLLGPERVVARNLARMGLIEWSEKTILGRITESGRQALSEVSG